MDLSKYDNTVFGGEITTANMKSSSRYYQLWSLWKEYVDYFVVGNDHLKRIGFINLLGIILTHKGYGFEKAEQFISTRIHSFHFQRARSGKGEMMKAKHRIVTSLDIESRYTMKDNVAACIGTTKLPDKATTQEDAIKRYGYLSHILDYSWDEGSVLIRPNKDMDNITDVFQGVMDEPGMVSKGMAWGDLEYATKTSICAGSYIFDELQKSLISKGFFQRMLLTYVTFSEEDKATMRRHVPLLKIRYNKGRIDKIMRSFKELCDEIPPPKNHIMVMDEDDEGNKTKVSRCVVCFDKDSVMKFNPRYDMIYEHIIKGQFCGRTQEVLESFGDMIQTLVDKISSQHAIIDGKDEVDHKDMLITLPYIKIHIASVLSLFDSIDGKQLTVNMRRELTIKDIIRKYSNVANQKFILDKLEVEKKSGKWDIGRNKTQTLLKEMVIDKKLLVETHVDTENGKSVNILIVPQ